MSEVEVTRTLPVKTLSYSSMSEYLKCPERWRRKYIENKWEPKNSAMVLGSAVGGAIGINYEQKVFSGEDMELGMVLDAYSDQWKKATEEGDGDVTWKTKPGTTKDHGVALTTLYHQTVSPSVRPVMTERKMTMRYPGADWVFTGKIDVEALGPPLPFEDDVVAPRLIDTKVKGKMFDEATIANDMQPDSYLALRASEGLPAESFEWHVLQHLKDGPKTTIVKAQRSAARVEQFQRRLLLVAREIAWRAENDTWQGAAPGAWWCSSTQCGFWNTCPFGGAS